MSQSLQNGDIPNAPRPYHTFTAQNIALHLSRDPTFALPLDEAMNVYKIPQLRKCLECFSHQIENGKTHISNIGGRPPAIANTLPIAFSHIKIWTSVHLQGKTYHPPHQLLQPYILQAKPPCEKWPQGHCDTVIVNLDEEQEWPYSSLQGMRPF